MKLRSSIAGSLFIWKEERERKRGKVGIKEKKAVFGRLFQVTLNTPKKTEMCDVQ